MVGMRPVLLIIAAITAVAWALHLTQAHAGRLDMLRTLAAYGPDETRGNGAYPRYSNDAEGYLLKILRPSHRVASQYWSIDEFAYAVVPPQDVVAVSTYAYDRKYSNVFLLADTFHPAVTTDPEIILKVDPDLMLVSSTGRADFTALLRNAGTPVFRMFTEFTTLDEIGRGILIMGHLTGRDDDARQLHERFRRGVERAASRKPAGTAAPRVLGYTSHYSYGDDTLFGDVVRTLGAVNVAAENGLHGYDPISSENVLRWNPEWIVAGAANGSARGVLQQLMQDPAVAQTTAGQTGQVLVFDNNVFLPMSPFTTRLLDVLGEALYANDR